MASASPAIRGAKNESPAPDPVTEPETGPDTEPAGTDPILAAERAHLRRSREYLRLMREDVLSLRALGGDPVSEEYLKADLYHRAEALKDIPDAPLFFGRLDYTGQPGTGQPGTGQPETGNYETGLSGTGQAAGDDGNAGH